MYPRELLESWKPVYDVWGFAPDNKASFSAAIPLERSTVLLEPRSSSRDLVTPIVCLLLVYA